MCNLFCLFGCLTLFGCRDYVCRKMVFFPPPAGYAIEEVEGRQVMWMIEDGKRLDPYENKRFHQAFVTTRKKSRISTMFVGYKDSKTTILFSHGNATDIGYMRDHLINMGKQLKVNMFCYDYTGYGLSSGKPSHSHVHSDAEAAYDYLTTKYAHQCQTLILYGQSLGSGATCYLAARNTPKKCDGIIIHSGLMSALRVIRDTPSTRWFDIFPNIDIIKKIHVPTFIIHGTADREIPIIHGESLSEAAPRAVKPWFVEGAGHNNIETEFRDQYFFHLQEFIRLMNTENEKVDDGAPSSFRGIDGEISERKNSIFEEHSRSELSRPHYSINAAPPELAVHVNID